MKSPTQVTPSIRPNPTANTCGKLTPENYTHWSLHISFVDETDNRALSVYVIADGFIVYGPISPEDAVSDRDFMAALPVEDADWVRLWAEKSAKSVSQGG